MGQFYCYKKIIQKHIEYICFFILFLCCDVYEKAQIFVGEKYEQIGKIGDFISGAGGGPGPVTSTIRGGTIEGGAALIRGFGEEAYNEFEK